MNHIPFLPLLTLFLTACHIFAPDERPVSIVERGRCEAERDKCLAPVYKQQQTCTDKSSDERGVCEEEVEVASTNCITTYSCKVVRQ